MKRYLLCLLLLPALAIGAVIKPPGQGNVTVFSDIITEVYYEIAGHTTTPTKVADSTLVKNRINAASRDLTWQFAVESDTTITVVSGTEVYNLPNDYYDYVWVASKAKSSNLEVAMQPVEATDFGQYRENEGIPHYFHVFKRQIYVTPTNTSGDSIRVHYMARNNVLSGANDTTNIDKEYITLLVLMSAEYILRAKSTDLTEMGKAKLEMIAALRAKEEQKLLEKRKQRSKVLVTE